MTKYICSRCLILFALLALRPTWAEAQYTIKANGAIPLDGHWEFAIDPADVGARAQWFSQEVKSRFDPVTVPHCFTVDPRYAFYNGTGWYKKKFGWSPQTGRRVLLHFDAVYYKTHVWLNGRKVGFHEGGYTPFRFDVTDFLKDGENLLAVSVNNDTWKHGTVPGAKDHNLPSYATPGWVNFGGITRPVYLTVKEEVYAENLKVESKPDLLKKTATLKVKLRIKNTTGKSVVPKPVLAVLSGSDPVTVSWKSGRVSILPGKTGIWEAEASLPESQVRLWNLDDPHLYHLAAVLGKDTISSHFGIRSVEVSGTQLLLNGQAIRAAGGNRVIDYKAYGALEPDWLIEKDFRLMKEAGMELHRLTHYTPGEYFYDLADRYGMLIITEPGNWQLSPDQLDADSIRLKFKQQFTEMAERDWNHPSVIAYSVGNEYLSELPAGQRWTRDMIAFARNLDPTRLYTFATMRLNILPERPEDEASQYVDFVCTNTYGNHARSLDHIHKLYPDKPVLISEWGVRSDERGGEAGQASHIGDVMKVIRERTYVIGASWWAYNDYQSRIFGTNKNGLRPWGLVGHERELRPAYTVFQKEMSAVVLDKESFNPGPEGIHRLRLRISARKDFPSYPVKGYELKAGNTVIQVPDLQPGEHTVIDVPVVGFDNTLTVRIVKPTGFTILEENIPLD